MVNVRKPSAFTGYVRAFTLVEVLVSVSVLSLMMIIIAETMKRTQDTISTASSHATEYQEARRALDAISNSLSQATMDAIWAYKKASNDPTSITGYERTSDHHFIIGSSDELLPSAPEAAHAVFFQAPMGKVEQSVNRRLHQLMNCWGFYIQYGSDLETRPSFLQNGQPVQLNPERKRFRLMQYMQASERSTLYNPSFGLNTISSRSSALRWFQQDVATASQPLADNVLALVLIPHVINVNSVGGGKTIEPAPDYKYDSRAHQWSAVTDQTRRTRHQLPPMVGVTLIIAEERSYESLVLREGEASAADAVRSVMDGKFTDYTKLEDDLKAVETGLADLKLHHQVIKANVALRNTQWISKDEL